MTCNIKIIDDGFLNITRGRDCGKWTQDNSYEDHEINGFTIVDDQSFHDLTIGFDPEYHNPYWLLVVHYDTGNSFHEDLGKIAFIDLYSKEDIAYQNEGLINAHLTLLRAYKDSTRYNAKSWPKNKPEPGYSIGLVLDDHTCYDYYAGAFIGYFETVTSIEVIELMRRNIEDDE